MGHEQLSRRDFLMLTCFSPLLKESVYRYASEDKEIPQATPDISTETSLELFSSPHYPYSLMLPDSWERSDAFKTDGKTDFVIDSYSPTEYKEEITPTIHIYPEEANLSLYDLEDFRYQTATNIELFNDAMGYSSEVTDEPYTIAGEKGYVISGSSPLYSDPEIINELHTAIFLKDTMLWRISLTLPVLNPEKEEVKTIFENALNSFTFSTTT